MYTSLTLVVDWSHAIHQPLIASNCRVIHMYAMINIIISEPPFLVLDPCRETWGTKPDGSWVVPYFLCLYHVQRAIIMQLAAKVNAKEAVSRALLDEINKTVLYANSLADARIALAAFYAKHEKTQPAIIKYLKAEWEPQLGKMPAGTTSCPAVRVA